MSLQQHSPQFINPVQQQELDTESIKINEEINGITQELDPVPSQEQNPAKKRKV